MQHLWIKNIEENSKIEGKYLVKKKVVAQTRQNKTYLTLMLSDKTGAVEAKVWDNAEKISGKFKEGDIVKIKGQATTYRNQLQIQINGIEQSKSPIDYTVFQESSAKDISKMLSELKKLVHRIKNGHLKLLIEAFLADHQFISKFKRAPAAKNFHHGYFGGLLEHTLSVSQLSEQIATHYPELDGDLLLSAAILHDIGKIDELNFELNIDYSNQGRLLGHIVLGVLMVEEKIKTIKDFPDELSLRLKHLILSHHGEFEFGSPKRPKFLEAFALHLIDDLDAKIAGLGKLIKEDRQEGQWTAFNALFQRYFYKKSFSDHTEEKDNNTDSKKQQQIPLFFVGDA